MKYFKEIILILAIVFAAVAASLVAYFMTENTRPGVWLDATGFKESKESKEFNKCEPKKNNFENSFLANGFSNYALYNYKKNQNDINDNGVTFSGNIDSYNKVTNDATTVNLWKNDFEIVNVVVKTKDISDKEKITVTVKPTQKGLKVSGGWLRFVKASNNNSNPVMPTPFGPNQSLWIPDAESQEQEQEAVSNRVYIYRLRIDRLEDTSDPEIKLSVNYKDEQDEKLIKVNSIDKDLNDANEIYKKDPTKEPGFDILDYPNDVSYYLNTQDNPEYKEDITKNEALVKDFNKLTTKDLNDSVNDRMLYMEYNWKRYWGPEYKYHHEMFNEKNFLIEWTHDGNNLKNWEIDEKGEYTKSNMWNEPGVGNSLWMWKAYADKDGTLHPYLNDEDWKPFDYYVYNMGKLGYTELQLNDILMMQFFTSVFYVQKDGKGIGEFTPERVTHDWQSKKGYQFNKEMTQQWVSHIKELQGEKIAEYNWVKDCPDLKVRFYIDEAYGEDIEKAVQLVNSLRDDSTKQYMQTLVAYPTRYMDAVGKWTKQLKDADVLYFYINSLYTGGNKQAEDFIKDRNSRGLITGQYQLDATASFDLARTQPGTLAYEMVQLSKQNEPNYLKYRAMAINHDKDSIEGYNSLDYHEPFGPYVAGDTMWQFPPVPNYKEWNDKIENDTPGADGLGTIRPSDPSTRLENLAYGVNLVKKQDILDSLGLLKKQDIQKYIQPVLTGSKNQSGNIFNFNNDDLPIEIISDGFSPSYIKNYQDGINSKYGQIDAVRVIESLINKAAIKEVN